MKKNLKIAFVNFYSGLASRGGETFVDSLASELTKQHDVILFQGGSADEKRYVIKSVNFTYDQEHPHLKLANTHLLKKLFLDYSSIKVLLFTLKIIPDLFTLRPSVIYSTDSGWEIAILRIVSWILKAKLLVSGQSGPGWNDRVNLFFHPDVFIALTQTQSQWASKATLWKKQKIVVIPNGVDINRFKPLGNSYSHGLNHPIILSVGAAIKSKRILDTIKAVSLISNASLLVVGTGPNENFEDSSATKLLGNRYKRIKVKHSEMPSIYRSADVFTLCSDSTEAFGIVYLEALATGLPCVVMDDLSRREILGEAGNYVSDPTDTHEYAEQLQRAIKSHSADQSINRARSFSWTEITRQYETLFSDLLKTR